MRAAQLRAILPQAETLLDGHPDVTSVGIGEKFSQGRPAGGYALVVSVRKKGRPTGSQIPGTIHIGAMSVPTDVRETPRAAFGVANSDLDGSDLLISSSVGRFGTLGLVAPELGGVGRIFGITCAHVVSAPDENHINDTVEAVVNGVTRKIGHVAYQSSFKSGQVNSVDLALVELNARGVRLAKAHVIQVFSGVVKESGSLAFSRHAGALRPHAYGGSTLTSRDEVDCQAFVEHRRLDIVDRPTGKTIRFGRAYQLAAGAPGVMAGHSGAIVVRRRMDGNLVAAGLLAAGEDGAGFAFSWSDIHAELERAGIALA